MKKQILLFSTLIIGFAGLTSCITSSSSLGIAPNTDMRKYNYVVLDNQSDIARDLDGAKLQIQKEISSFLKIVTAETADSLIKNGSHVLSHSVYTNRFDNVTDRGENYFVNLYFKDYATKEDKLIIKCNPFKSFFLRQLKTDLKAAFR